MQVALSGGADPIHIGHLRMIQEAQNVGDVTWILNTDEWLVRKKGAYFMCWEDRAELLRGYGCKVVKALDDDGTVCQSLELLKPDIFCNGGDRKIDNTPEEKLCKKLRITTVYNVGGEKVRSSSELVKEWIAKTQR